MQKSIIILATALLATVVVARDKPKLDPVQKKYKPKIEYAKKQYTKAIEKIRKQMIQDYEKYLNQAMQQRNLKAANEYQMKIKCLKEGKELVATEKDDEVELGMPKMPTDSQKASVSIRGIPTGRLGNGAMSYSNRKYTWLNVPKNLQGMKYTMNKGGKPEEIKVTVRKPGLLYLALHLGSDADRKKLNKLGFFKTKWTMNYSDKGKTEMTIYSAKVSKSFRIPKPDAWTGMVVIFK